MMLSHTLLCIAGAGLFLARPGVAVGDCGCPSCTSSILNKDADGYSVRNRIDWVIANMGQSEQKACSTGEHTPFLCQLLVEGLHKNYTIAILFFQIILSLWE